MACFNSPRDVRAASPEQMNEWAYGLGFEDATHGRAAMIYRRLDFHLGRGGPWVDHVRDLVKTNDPAVVRMRAHYLRGVEDGERNLARSGREVCGCALWPLPAHPCQPARWRGTIWD